MFFNGFFHIHNSLAAPFAKSHSVLTAALPHLCSYTGAQLIGKGGPDPYASINPVPPFPMAKLLLVNYRFCDRIRELQLYNVYIIRKECRIL